MTSRAALAPVVLALTLASAHTARADDLRDERTATYISVGGVAGSVGLVAAGVIGKKDSLVEVGAVSSLVSPSFGAWYADRYYTGGLAIRLLGIGTMLAGAVVENQCFDSNCHKGQSGKYIIGAGVAVYGAGMVYDVVTAHRAAREYNRAHVAVAPVALAASDGPAFGVALAGRF